MVSVIWFQVIWPIRRLYGFKLFGSYVGYMVSVIWPIRRLYGFKLYGPYVGYMVSSYLAHK